MTKTNYINDGIKINNVDGTEEIIHIPYNLNNILVKEQDIIQILARYNVKLDKINHLEYIQQAFTHKSYCKKNIFPDNILECAKEELGNPSSLIELQPESYERIEYFGDRVLKLIVSMYLFHRYPDQDEGFMTRLQTKIEDKKNLASMSREIGLNKYFLISKQIETLGGRDMEKIHEDVFESFIGALFLSNGFECCLFLITNLLETLIDYSEKLYLDNNYKDRLLRVHHQNKWSFPQYVTIHFEGPPHKRKYIMGVERHDVNELIKKEEKCIGYGIGTSKKEGEQNAAKMALIKLGILKQDQYNQSDIYEAPWSLINNYDGTNGFLIPLSEEERNRNISTKENEKIIPKVENKQRKNKKKIEFVSDSENEFSDKSI